MTQVVKAPPSNGVKTAPVAEPVKPLTVVKDKPTKTELTADLQPLDERLHRLNQLFELQTKFNRLQQSKQKLNEFKLSNKTENIVLTIDDEDGNATFETKNPAVISEVLDFVKKTIDVKQSEIAGQLKW